MVQTPKQNVGTTVLFVRPTLSIFVPSASLVAIWPTIIIAISVQMVAVSVSPTYSANNVYQVTHSPLLTVCVLSALNSVTLVQFHKKVQMLQTLMSCNNRSAVINAGRVFTWLSKTINLIKFIDVGHALLLVFNAMTQIHV